MAEPPGPRPLLVRAVGGLGTVLAWLLGLGLLFGSWLSAPAMPDTFARVVTIMLGLLAGAILVGGMWWSMRARTTNLVWALGPWATVAALAMLAQQIAFDV